MNLKPLSYNKIMSIADLWRDIGGALEIEIGALEPLLWRDGEYQINDVVNELTKRDFSVSLTTNGQILDIFAEKLSRAGLSLLRTSWHSTNPLMFKEISGGYGNYERFMHGIKVALESGIKISFNRVLHRGYIDDIPKQLSFIEKYKSRLKLYTLLWTSQGASTYELYYQDWHPIVRESVLPRTLKIVKVGKKLGRSRIQFHLIEGGLVEVKLGKMLDRTIGPCVSCSVKSECEESFGDYIRIDPSLHLYFCYMRRDLGFKITEYFAKPNDFKQKLQEKLRNLNVESVLATTPLRLTVTPSCNFNCRAPGALHGWCMEESSGFIYPKIRATLLK